MPSGYYADVASPAAPNTFTRKQTFIPSLNDVTTTGAEKLTNGNWGTGNLTGWNDDASGWSVVGGKLTHTPGSSGTITQDVTLANGFYLLEIGISGMTAGYWQAYDDDNLYCYAPSTFKSLAYFDGSTDTIGISVDDAFDGQIDFISLKATTATEYPATVTLYDLAETVDLQIRTWWGALYWGNQAGRRSANNSNIGIGNNALAAIVDEGGNVAIGNQAGEAARCRNNILIGPAAGQFETVDNRLHIGSGGDIISGTMNFGSAATQALKFHAKRINMADLPTSSSGLSTGDLWVDSGVIKRA